MIKIKLNEKLVNYDGKEVPAMNLLDQVAKVYNNCQEKIQEYQSQKETTKFIDLLKNTLKKDFRPFIFIDHLMSILDKSMAEEIESITKKQVIKIALNLEVGKDIEEFIFIDEIQNSLNKKVLEIKSKKKANFLLNRLIKIKGLEPESHTKMVVDLKKQIEVNF